MMRLTGFALAAAVLAVLPQDSAGAAGKSFQIITAGRDGGTAASGLQRPRFRVIDRSQSTNGTLAGRRDRQAVGMLLLKVQGIRDSLHRSNQARLHQFLSDGHHALKRK